MTVVAAAGTSAIDRTGQSFAQFAFAVGFDSLRRFNEAFLEICGRPTSLFRKRPRTATSALVASSAPHPDTD
jgi:methylphosphotriester-DNA--protein-cysteine methyltransferase